MISNFQYRCHKIIHQANNQTGQYSHTETIDVEWAVQFAGKIHRKTVYNQHKQAEREQDCRQTEQDYEGLNGGIDERQDCPGDYHHSKAILVIDGAAEQSCSNPQTKAADKPS